MKINSTVLGMQDINPEEVLTFPQGIPGFANCTSFKLFHEERETPVVHWLQSIDQPDVIFSVVDPAQFGLNYEMTLSDEEAALLQADSADDLVVLLITYKMPSGEAHASGINANINGPIILNFQKRLGMQKVLNRQDAVHVQP